MDYLASLYAAVTTTTTMPIPQAVDDAVSTGDIIVWAGAAAVPVLAGTMEALRLAGLPDRWRGIVGMVIGAMGGSILAVGVSRPVAILQGVIAGLSATGLYRMGQSVGQNGRARVVE